MLCDTLALKLMTAGNTLAATLCYICARNIDKTVEIWSRSLRTEHEGKSYVELLQVNLVLVELYFDLYILATILIYFFNRLIRIWWKRLLPCLGNWAEAI